ncbi:hypothetical protein AB0M87_31240 [Streptomyces sp. NPDC051320]|uniref:hypothetical protein n=1 Tax=Streptomyces sp. NPDC051320 TaxID=3154644 RepID=UPI00341879A5
MAGSTHELSGYTLLTRIWSIRATGNPAGRLKPKPSPAASWAERSRPERIRGRAGDLLPAHCLRGHNVGGNTSNAVRRGVYFRVKRTGHDERWRAFLRDPWLDYDAVRALWA